MRDARILAWVLADPTRFAQLTPEQRAGITRMAGAEGLAVDLEGVVAGEARPIAATEQGDLSVWLCRAATDLFTGTLEHGLRDLWQIHLRLEQGAPLPDFWAMLLAQARAQGVVPNVSRALRLCHHLFETKVDPFLAWRAQRSDIFYVGHLLARDGAGRETAPWLRFAFRLRARWKARRA